MIDFGPREFDLILVTLGAQKPFLLEIDSSGRRAPMKKLLFVVHQILFLGPTLPPLDDLLVAASHVPMLWQSMQDDSTDQII